MLEQSQGLSSEALRAIAELERQVVDADGGRLKLEWKTLRNRSGERVEDLLWWQQERLCGFLGIYSFGSPLELAGMVAPDARGRGIGTELLKVAIDLCRARGEQTALLVVPRASTAGRALALGHGGQLDHSEHALLLTGGPKASQRTHGVSVRPAIAADRPFVSGLIKAGFGYAIDDFDDEADSTRGQTLVIEHNGKAVGTIRVTRDDQGAGVYGFVIDPELQGRGFGREALRQVCDWLTADGAAQVGLEVAVDNERALTLYTSLGFEPVTTEDYYSIQVG